LTKMLVRPESNRNRTDPQMSGSSKFLNIVLPRALDEWIFTGVVIPTWRVIREQIEETESFNLRNRELRPEGFC
jgi:hypothetical protein